MSKYQDGLRADEGQERQSNRGQNQGACWVFAIRQIARRKLGNVWENQADWRRRHGVEFGNVECWLREAQIMFGNFPRCSFSAVRRSLEVGNSTQHPWHPWSLQSRANDAEPEGVGSRFNSVHSAEKLLCSGENIPNGGRLARLHQIRGEPRLWPPELHDVEVSVLWFLSTWSSELCFTSQGWPILLPTLTPLPSIWPNRFASTTRTITSCRLSFFVHQLSPRARLSRCRAGNNLILPFDHKSLTWKSNQVR